MFSKEEIKDFINFKILITETILKYAFMVFIVLCAVGVVVMVIGAWISAFRIGVGYGLMSLIFAPLVGVIVFGLYIVCFRILFECLLALFLVYREMKALNDKIK